jgi:hypothetical protein
MCCCGGEGGWVLCSLFVLSELHTGNAVVRLAVLWSVHLVLGGWCRSGRCEELISSHTG